jgi:peptidoglycan/LPS O-acetylase OafA/YrhL
MNGSPAAIGLTHLGHPQPRADIDGLRGIAVLSVMGFHAFPDSVTGGFVGVDIFFVISGFLISGIIMGNLERGTFSFAEFYARRVRRIFPALILVMAACFVFGWLVLFADEYKQLGKHILASAGFVSNLIFWQEAGYFDHAGQTKPLLHLWSLGIEEQFYIVWPLLLYLAWRRRLGFLLLVVSLTVASFAFSVGTSYGDMTQAFYSPIARFWELLAGCLLAWFALHKKDRLQCCAGQAELGGLLICAAFFFITREAIFPGYLVLLPVLGACLIIAAGPRAWLNRAVLSHPLLVWIGLISYPLYLWHWPLLSFARIVGGDAPAPDLRAATIAVALVLAWLTYALLEKPIRFGKLRNIATAPLLASMCVVAATGYFTYAQDGIESRVRDYSKITRAAGEWQYPGNLRAFSFDGRDFLYQPSGATQTTLFVGDSDMEQYYPRIDELITHNPSSTNSAIFSTGEGCAPLPRTTVATYARCADLLDSSLAFALSRKDVSTVVIAGLWYQYLSGEARAGGTQSYFHADDGREYPIATGNAGYHKALAALSDYIGALKRDNKRVVLVLNTPLGDALDPFYMVRRNLAHFPKVFEVRGGGINLTAFEAKYGTIKNDLIGIAEKNRAELIDPVKTLCGGDVCASVDRDGEPLYRDGQHLRPTFVRNRASFMDTTVAE